MKIKLLYTLFLALLCGITLMGNKNGRASQAGRGNTAAPGDETNSNGSARTCNFCHGNGSIFATVDIAVVDSAGNPVSAYTPGVGYFAKVKIDTLNGSSLPAGYGFQMIALRDSDNTDLDGFSDFVGNNYKLATIQNGRTYAEHDNISGVDTFMVAWKAPEAGTGPVTFYAAGNAVNGNGQSSGDGADTTFFRLPEGIVMANHPAMTKAAGMQAFPNPFTDNLQISTNIPEKAAYTLQMFNMQGNMVWEATREIPRGEFQWAIPASFAPPGAYLVRLSGGGKSHTVKVAKL